MTRALQNQIGYKGTVNLTTLGAPNVDATGPGMPCGLLQANFAFPAAYVAQFSIALPQNNTGIRCLAIVAWKLGGVLVRRVIDIAQGVSIQGTCEACDIQAQDVSNLVFGGGAQSYSVSATLARGTRASTSDPPTLYDNTYSIGPNGSFYVAVPTDSGIVSSEAVVIDTTTAGTDPIFLEVAQYTGTIASPGGVLKQYSPAVSPGFIRLAPGVGFLQFLNKSATDSVYVTNTWGVDG